MKLRKVAFWFVTVIIVALVSPFAAMLWEGFALQHGYDNGTPGLIVAQERFPEKGLAGLAKAMRVELEVDSVVCFVVLMGVIIFIAVPSRPSRARTSSHA